MNSNVEQVRFSAEFDLAEFLKENNYIQEHVYESSMIDRKHSSLFENRGSGDPRVYSGIHFDHFKNIWNSFSTYPDYESVYNALYPDNKNIQGYSKRQTLNRMIGHWVVGVDTPGTDDDFTKVGIPEGKSLKAYNVGERDKKVREFISKQASEVADDVSPDESIDPGQRGKKSQTGNVEKASDLIPGELYADMTRIPKRQWGGWWRKLVQHKTSVEPPKQAITSLRKWTRHFILGYQIEDTLSYEIWYNSQDGTFSVHDRWGNPVRGGSKIPVMKDALNLLFQNVAQAAPSDSDFFSQPSNELRRVNMSLEKEGQASEKAAKQRAREMRQDKEKAFSAFDFSEEAQKKRAKQAGRRNTSVPDSNDQKFSKEDERDYDEQGDKAREETTADVGEENNTKEKTARKMKAAQEKQRSIRDKLKKRAEAAERRERSKQSDDPADSQGSNTASSQETQGDVDTKPADGEFIPSSQGQSEKQDYKAKPYIVIDGATVMNPLEITNQIKQAATNPNVDLDDIRFNNMPKKVIADLENFYKSMEQIGDDIESGQGNLKLVSPSKQEQQDVEAEETSREQNRRSNEDSMKGNVSLEDEFDDDFNVSLDDEFGADLDDDLLGGMGDDPFESLRENSVESTGVEGSVDLGEPEDNPLYNKQSNQRVMEARQKAERSQYTRQMIQNMFFEGLVKEYYQTRSRHYKSVLEKVTDWFKLFRGRNEKIQVPTNIVSRKQRIKGFFSGAQARSDFIIGVSIRDEVNYEIWYVQEISSDGKDQYASFYVYDVTAEKIIKANIPYYRNAIDTIVNKIGK